MHYQKDVHINKKDHNGISALHGAIENGYVDVVEVLLNAKGIDVNQSLVKLAIDEEEEDIVELLTLTQLLLNTY